MKKVCNSLKNVLQLLAILIGILYVLMVPVGCLVYAIIHGGFF